MPQENARDILWQEEAGDPKTSAQRLETLSTDMSLRRIVVSNPAAPASLLVQLAQDQDVQVRQAVASNPNTPWQTLEYLAKEFPYEFLHNPIMAFHLLANPEQIRTDDTFWEVLLRAAPIPEPWWNWLMRDPKWSISETTRLHIQYAGEATHPYG